MLISAQKVVTLDYVLTNKDGDVLDSSEGGEPLAYLHGASQIVPGLERALEGLKVGDERDVIVEPHDGFGEPNPEGVFAVPRAAFPSDVTLSVGDALMGEDDEGHAVPVRVVELRDDVVVVDANHPLAGQRLHYHVAVRDVREATPEELAAGEAGCDDDHDHDHE